MCIRDRVEHGLKQAHNGRHLSGRQTLNQLVRLVFFAGRVSLKQVDQVAHLGLFVRGVECHEPFSKMVSTVGDGKGNACSSTIPQAVPDSAGQRIPLRYSYLSASTGSSFEARRAGTIPLITPTISSTIAEPRTASAEMRRWMSPLPEVSSNSGPSMGKVGITMESTYESAIPMTPPSSISSMVSVRN